MRTRHLPHKKPIGTSIGPSVGDEKAAKKIQSLHRGRLIRQQHVKIKVSALSSLLPSIRNDMFQLKQQQEIFQKQLDLINEPSSNILRRHQELLQKQMNMNNKEVYVQPKQFSAVYPLLIEPLDEKKDVFDDVVIEEDEEFKEGNDDYHLENGYNLSPSMWDVSMLFGTNAVGFAGSVYGFLLLILNIGIQFVFAYIVAETFTVPAFSDSTILGFRSWRRNVAQNAEFMDELSEVSLAARICNNDPGLEISGSQAAAHQNLRGYLNGNVGSIMSALTVTMWLLTVAKEVTVFSNFWRAIYCIPKGDKTVVSEDGDSIVMISRGRRLFVQCVQLCRLAVVGSLGYAGTAWLVNTVSVTDLILNAVALEFVLCVDEIIFEALAPRRLTCVLNKFSEVLIPFPPPREWKGLDTQSLSIFFSTCGVIFTVGFLMILPFASNLALADNALCAGKQDFVDTISKTGIPIWSISESYLVIDEKADLTKANSSGDGRWELKDKSLVKLEGSTLNFAKKVIDNIVDGYGFGTQNNVTLGGCGKDVSFYPENQTIRYPTCAEDDDGTCFLSYCDARYYSGLVDTTGNVIAGFSEGDNACCVSEQIRSPSIDGGRLSVNGFTAELVENSIDIWNPGCVDTLGQLPVDNDDDSDRDVITYSFANLQGGALSDTLGGICGVCPADTPLCDPDTNTCVELNCSAVEKYCLEDNPSGVRARQFCSATCGCWNPSSQLVLSGAEYGCPSTCDLQTSYEFAVADLVCEDAEFSNSSDFLQYTEEVTRLSLDWPGHWKDSWLTTALPVLEYYGCDGIYYLKYSIKTLPMDFCAFGGTIWPIKPMTSICPETCNCENFDLWGCPETCPVPATNYSYAY